MRAYYAHPVDVLRKFDPTLSESDLEAEALFGADDLEKVWSRIEEVESDFETRAKPARAVRVGVPGHPDTYETQADRHRHHAGATAALDHRHRDGVKVSLNHREVIPFDADEGDQLELRVGRDTWKDITDQRGSRWEMDPERGWVRVYRRQVRHVRSDAVSDQLIRCTYRHGGLGGSPDRAGETTLEDDVDDVETEWSVADPQRLPPRGVAYVGASEYVLIEDVDYDDGTLSVRRGARATAESSHDEGTTIHYCPTDVRGAIAGQVAAELVMNDDITDNLATPDDDFSRDNRIVAWQDEYDSLVASWTEVRVL